MAPRIVAPPQVEAQDPERHCAVGPVVELEPIRFQLAGLDEKTDLVLATLQRVLRQLERERGSPPQAPWRPRWRGSTGRTPMQTIGEADGPAYMSDHASEGSGGSDCAQLNSNRLAMARANLFVEAARASAAESDVSTRDGHEVASQGRASVGMSSAPSTQSWISSGRRFSNWVSASMWAAYSTQTTKTLEFRDRQRRVWQFVEDKQSGLGAMMYYYIVSLLIGASVCIAMLDLSFPEASAYRRAAFVLEILLALELVVRFTVCPNRHTFWLDAYNMVDLIVFLGGTLPLLSFAAVDVEPHVSYAVRVFSPLLLMLRYLRRFDNFHLLVSAFKESVEALPVLLYTLLLIALFHSGLIYLLEPRDALPMLGDAMWLTMTTMSTVGYSDGPASMQGRAATLLLSTLSGLYLAIPIGIVGTTFSKIWEDRDRLLLTQQLRRRIARAGHTPMDLIKMFKQLDLDGNNRLTGDEFNALLPMIDVSIPDELASRIFETFDHDGEGSIDFEEFIRGIYPAHHFYMTTMTRRRNRAGVRVPSAQHRRRLVDARRSPSPSHGF